MFPVETLVSGCLQKRTPYPFHNGCNLLGLAPGGLGNEPIINHFIVNFWWWKDWDTYELKTFIL